MLNKAEFARRIGVDRGTINRWETGQTKPTDVEILNALARVFQLDYGEVLAAAGFRPVSEAPKPEPPRDEEAEEIMRSNLPLAIKRDLLQVLAEERERDKQRRMEHIRRLMQAQRRAG
jgi:transcriptional regulator with XRE-family HTH domain